MMCQPSDDFTGVSHRIETLTNILQHLNHKAQPRNNKDLIPSFLRHFTTLLTYDNGDKCDKEPKRVVAVTGTFEKGEPKEGGPRVKALVVTQNANSNSNKSWLDINKVTKDPVSFKEVVARPYSKDIQEHIKDMITVLSSCNPGNAKQVEALQIFVIARCYRKLRARFNSYEKLFGVGLDEDIRKWDGKQREWGEASEWISVPVWVSKFLLPGIEVKSRTLDIGGNPLVQWEFSDNTKGIFALFLAAMISEVGKAFEAVDEVKEGITPTKFRPTAREQDAYELLNATLGILKFYVQPSNSLAEKLLIRTSLGSVLAKTIGSPGNNTEYMESPGQYVLQHLRTIIAWHVAVGSLVEQLHSVIDIKNIDIRVVEVPYHRPVLLPVSEMKKEYSSRYPKFPEHLDLLEEGYPSRFKGTIHAEATLMGLLAFFKSDQCRISYGQDIENVTELQEILKSGIDNMYITVGRKCCWCCDRLAYHLGRYLQTEFKLLGTHGMLYAWSPPRVGIDVSVLRALEDDLWDELQSALTLRAPPSLSRQNSGTSTKGEAFELEDIYKEKIERRSILNNLT